MTPRPPQIDGETRLMGLLGESIAYTQSPRLHNRAAALLGQNVVYLPLPLPAAQVKGFLDAAWHLGAVGFNVTQPHKGLVAGLLPGGKLRSVNTLTRGKTWWEGASTDAGGFARGLKRLDRTLDSFDELVLLGAGGAATALVEHLAGGAKGPRKLHALRRKPDGDAALTDVAGKLKFSLAELSVNALAKALKGKGESCLLVQATSAPLHGDDMAALIPALDGFGGVLVDLVYGKPSALYYAAVARDVMAQDGEAMLIEQARLAQELWWGKAAPYEELALALRGK